MSVTREKILELGENLIRTKGYNAFSYQDISSELGIKNAAVHYYFPSKENLATSIVKTNILRFEEMADNMNSRKFDAWQQLESFLKIYVKSHREQKKCIVGALSPDFYSLSETTQSELKRMIRLIIDWLTALLAFGIQHKVFNFKEDPATRAMVIFSSLVASLQLSVMMEEMDYKVFCQAIMDGVR